VGEIKLDGHPRSIEFDHDCFFLGWLYESDKARLEGLSRLDLVVQG
jgi:hypothetical protein